MPIMARTSGGIYTPVTNIYDAQGNAISKVYDTQGNVVFKKTSAINLSFPNGEMDCVRTKSLSSTGNFSTSLYMPFRDENGRSIKFTDVVGKTITLNGQGTGYFSSASGTYDWSASYTSQLDLVVMNKTTVTTSASATTIAQKVLPIGINGTYSKAISGSSSNTYLGLKITTRGDISSFSSALTLNHGCKLVSGQII